MDLDFNVLSTAQGDINDAREREREGGERERKRERDGSGEMGMDQVRVSVGLCFKSTLRAFFSCETEPLSRHYQASLLLLPLFLFFFRWEITNTVLLSFSLKGEKTRCDTDVDALMSDTLMLTL